MGMRQRPQIRHEGTISHDGANDEVNRLLHRGQDQVGEPEVPLLGREDEIETSKLGCTLHIGYKAGEKIGLICNMAL